MKNLPIRPALVSLFALCAMVSLGLLACGSNDAPLSASAEGQVSAVLPADTIAH